MANICFDFEQVFKDEYQKRLSGLSIYKFLDENDISLQNFIKNIISEENTYYFSSSSLTRDPSKEVGLDIYSNYFLRPKYNSNIIKNNKSFLINGDFIFNRDNGDFYFKVKDIYMSFDSKIKKFEKEFSFEFSYKEKNKKGNGNSILARNIIETTPYIYSKENIELLDKWDKYLEFEKSFFSSKIDFYKIRSYLLIELKEVKRSIENFKK